MTIELLDGSTVDTDFLRFDEEHYHFYLGSGGNAQDLTDLIRRADKLAIVEDFDVEKENERIYVEKYWREHKELPPEIGSDSVWWNFTEQILTDPLDAPFKAGLGWLTSTTTGQLIMLAGAIWLWRTYGPKNK